MIIKKEMYVQLRSPAHVPTFLVGGSKIEPGCDQAINMRDLHFDRLVTLCERGIEVLGFEDGEGNVFSLSLGGVKLKPEPTPEPEPEPEPTPEPEPEPEPELFDEDQPEPELFDEDQPEPDEDEDEADSDIVDEYDALTDDQLRAELKKRGEPSNAKRRATLLRHLRKSDEPF